LARIVEIGRCTNLVYCCIKELSWQRFVEIDLTSGLINYHCENGFKNPHLRGYFEGGERKV